MSHTLQSLNPVTGDVVAILEVDDEESVRSAVDRARADAPWWDGLGFAGRKAVLDRWRGTMARRMAQLAAVVSAETGKPSADAQLEIGLAIDHLAWAAGHAGKLLGVRRVPSGPLMANQAATIERRPLGVVAVIGPWNYPVFTPMGSIAYALAAGNTVVFKPSELTPVTARWLADTLAEVVPGRDLLQVVVGTGEVGALLCRAGADKVAFTGSAATGRKVMAACAESLTPVVIEGGGKDAFLVDEDADIDAAVDAAAWGAFANAGQTCLGVERIYVHERVYDQFLQKLTEQAGALRVGDRPDAQYGPMTRPAQVDVIRRHVDDALARGGRAVVGGPDGIGDRFVEPIVLVDVPEDSQAVTEETFGPTVTVARVSSMDEAVDKANATAYGLGSTVFSRSRGGELARRLRSGSTSVNGVISYVGIPALPMGGVGDSGFGRIHGEDGLREFTYAKAVARQRFKAPLVVTSFARGAKADATFARLITAIHGGKNLIPTATGRRRIRR